MLRAIARGAQGLALLVPVAGCVLVVPAIEPKSSCTIAGSTSCATCLRSSCQAAIDTCCGDPGCSGSDGHSVVLDAVDACGNGDKDACATSLQEAGSGAAGAIRSCIRQSCDEACLAGATIAVKWTCDSPRAEESACARCIYRSCASRLDACCADSACSKNSVVQDDMSACVSGDEAGCAYARTRYDSGLDGALRTCIAQQCFTSCMGDGRPHASCEFYSGGAYCSCSDAEESAGPECSTTAVGGSCVVGKGGCTCGSYACGQGSYRDSCSCRFRGGSGGTSCRAPATGDGRCCLKLEDRGVSCECDDLGIGCSASTDEYAIDSCDQATVLAALREAGRVATRCSR